MDNKDWLYIVIMFVYILTDKLLKKKCPAIWWKLQIPLLVILTALSSVIIGIILSGMEQVRTSPVSAGDKWVTGICLGALTVTLIAGNISMWKDWLQERAKRKL